MVVKNEFDRRYAKQLIAEFETEIAIFQKEIDERKGFIEKYQKDIDQYDKFICQSSKNS